MVWAGLSTEEIGLFFDKKIPLAFARLICRDLRQLEDAGIEDVTEPLAPPPKEESLSQYSATCIVFIDDEAGIEGVTEALTKAFQRANTKIYTERRNASTDADIRIRALEVNLLSSQNLKAI